MFVVRRIKNDELTHHGIKNQHWGVRNGPPYPLDRKTSARIKKGHNEKLRDKKKVGVSHYSSASGKSYRFPAGYGVERAKSEGDRWKDNESHLSETGLFRDSYGNMVYRNLLSPYHDVGAFIDSNMKDDSKRFNNLRLDSYTKNDIRKNGFSNHMKLLRNVNMDEQNESFGSTRNNCSKCSDMVELIMRGLDPKQLSAGRSQYGMLDTATEYHWDGAIPYKEKSLTNIENRIKSFGNHGSGTIGVRRADGSGHSMHFSRLSDGSIEVQDGQIAKTYSSIGQALSAEGHDFNQFCKITRLDCATPNIKHMEEDSVLRLDYAFSSDNGIRRSVTRSNGDNTSTHYFGSKYDFTEWGKKQ